MKLGKFSFGRKRYFALTGNRHHSLLAEILKVQSAGKPVMQVLAKAEGSLDNQVTLNRLISSAPDIQGEIAIALPLSFFEIISISLPLIKIEAVGRALPYHLAKLLSRPLSDYVYDWQIVRKQKESLDLNVYLFSAKTFNKIRQEFNRKQLEVKYLEADVFAGFNYLNLTQRLKEDDTALCALIWPDSVSLAIYEARQLKLVRNVTIRQPKDGFALPAPPSEDQLYEDDENPAKVTLPDDLSLSEDALEDTANDEPASEEPAARHEISFPRDDDSSSILEDFFLTTKETPAADIQEISTPQKQADDLQASQLDQALTSPNEIAWQDYLEEINLEIIRTRDYYTSVAKGGKINKLFAGGAEIFWNELVELTRSSLELTIEPLEAEPSDGELAAIEKAICIGTGTRW